MHTLISGPHDVDANGSRCVLCNSEHGRLFICIKLLLHISEIFVNVSFYEEIQTIFQVIETIPSLSKLQKWFSLGSASLIILNVEENYLFNTFVKQLKKSHKIAFTTK